MKNTVSSITLPSRNVNSASLRMPFFIPVSTEIMAMKVTTTIIYNWLLIVSSTDPFVTMFSPAFNCMTPSPREVQTPNTVATIDRVSMNSPSQP